MSATARVTYTPPIWCHKKTRAFIDWVIPGTYQVYVPATCVCNERVSLFNRHLIDRKTQNYDEQYMDRCMKRFNKMHQVEQVERVKYSDVIKAYRGGKRARYVRAAEELRNGAMPDKETNIRMFVKVEKFPLDDPKPPRAIQARSPVFCLALATYLKPVEHWVYESLGRSRCFAKGLNQIQRAELALEQWSEYEDPIAIMLDHSKFDSSVTVTHLKYTHKFYQRIIPSRYLRYLNHKQINNKAITGGGIRYRVNGTRMSGDYDTALGNSLLNYMCLFTYFGHEARYLIDGDDSVVFLERTRWEAKNKQMDLLEHCSRWGFTTKMEISGELEGVEFCQAKYASSGVFMKEPWRALSRSNIGVKPFVGKIRQAYLAGKAQGLAMACPRTPLLYPIFKAISESHGVKWYDDETRWNIDNGVDEGPPTQQDRESFARLYNISPTEQINIEAQVTRHVKAVVISDIIDYWRLTDIQDAAGYTGNVQPANRNKTD